ncbi:MAG: type I pullulanase [Prevotella sp.]|nr:type I pullulanase [Prevotella sp.]
MKRLLMAAMTTAMIACDPPKDAPYWFDEMTYSPSETVFKVFAPDNAKCFVVIDNDSVEMTCKPVADDSLMTEGYVYKAVVKGDLKGKTYELVVNGQSSPGVFAKAVTVNGQKGVVVDLRDSDPEGWATDKGPHPATYGEWMVYELHHRDFSINRPDAQHKGKFLALSEPWAIEHLQQLGINAVHILPSYDFGSVDETRLDEPQYNWGYDPVNYNVPDGSYSTDPADPLCRIREFKQMVQALHQAGINVVLDVVYNHTYDIDHSNFQRTYPDYYYRVGSNGSGCGNETASEKLMMRRFMIASVRHWISEYHIDGFRFDLMGVHDIETMNQIRQAVDEIDPTIFIYGEGWSAGQCALPLEQQGVKANIARMPRIAAFSDEIRDALRGPFNDDKKGAFLAGKPGEEMSLMAGIAGMINHPQIDYAKVNYSDEAWAQEPTQMMSYVSCHDDMCLVDRLRASIPGITDEELIRLDLLAQTAVFTSQGVPFMLSGEELLRTKQGVHNSFESPDAVNQLDWTARSRYPQVMDYYQKLTALRQQHPAFRMGKAELVNKHLTFLPSQPCMVAFRIAAAPNDEWQDIVVVLNANKRAVKVETGEGNYTIVAANGSIDLQGMGTVSGPVVTVAPQSALIIHK